MHEEFGVPRSKEEKIDSLIHLYVDGGLNRRDLLRRLSRLAGGAAAAATILTDAGLAQQQPPANADDLRVGEDDPAILWRDVTYPGQAGPVQALLAWPRPFSGGRRLRGNDSGPDPAVLVIHENRGLNEHVRDVTRRIAKAGFVALGVDLLSRQGGTGAFPNDTARSQAYGRTVEVERFEDMRSGVAYLRTRDDIVVPGQIGAVGFCAGGGNIFYGVYNGLGLQAAVPFYGSPPNPLPAADRVTTPILAIYSETDRNQAARIPALAENLVAARVTFGVQVYKGTAHAFFNDTGAVFNRPAAEDAWSRTIAFLNQHLRPST
jgi:carboxymethylenebutenolidase